MVSILYMVSLEHKGHPIQTRALADQACHTLRCTLGMAEDSDLGLWLVTLSVEDAEIFEGQGYFKKEAGDFLLEGEMP